MQKTSFKAENVTSVAFISGYKETWEIQRNTMYSAHFHYQLYIRSSELSLMIPRILESSLMHAFLDHRLGTVVSNGPVRSNSGTSEFSVQLGTILQSILAYIFPLVAS